MALTANELAEFLGAKLMGDGTSIVSGVALPENAKAQDLVYVESARHELRAEESAANCVLAPAGATRGSWIRVLSISLVVPTQTARTTSTSPSIVVTGVIVSGETISRYSGVSCALVSS